MSDTAIQSDNGYTALTDALTTSFRLLRFVLIAVLVAYLFSGVFVVRQHEKALVLVFGRVAGSPAARVRGPGIHFTWPRPIAEVIRIPAERVQTIECRMFWYNAPAALGHADHQSFEPTLKPLLDGYMLTGDANILHSIWLVNYIVYNPEAYLFAFENIRAVISNELAHAVIGVSARYPVDQALRLDVESFRSAVEQTLHKRFEQIAAGVRIERVELPALAPPRQVAAAFASVISAEQERSANISAARAEATRALNEAAGDAGRIRSEGTALRQRFAMQTAADADYFTQVHEQYRRNPALTRQTLWQDTVTRVLAAVEEKYVIQAGPSGRQELRLILSPEKKPIPQARRNGARDSQRN